MNDLTEKSKIKEGYYYAIVNGEQNIVKKVRGLKHPYCNGFCCDCCKYLAPVPSYEEWKEKNEENAQLKELLKECKESVYVERANDNSLGDTIWNYTTKLINEINKALGEDK